MRILLINPPYQTLTANVGVGRQIPLGLLMVGGPLLDADAIRCEANLSECIDLW
jgi:hypothetical protein